MDIALRGLSALLMIALPLAVGVYLTRRWQKGWGLVFIGAVTFLVSQVGHIPFNGAVLNPVLARLGFGAGPDPQPIWALAAASLLLGLSAGVFEEGARFLVFRFWIRRARSYREGVLFGLGHGGAEAIAVAVLVILQLSQAYALRGQDLSTIVPADQLAVAQAQLEAYWAVPAPVALLSAVERASTLAIQITLAVLVLQAFTRRRGWLWFLAAISWHAVIDAVAVFTGVQWGVYQGSVAGAVAAEIMVAVFALISLWILLRLRPTEPEVEIISPSPPLPVGPLASPPLRSDRIDDTRYTPSG